METVINLILAQMKPVLTCEQLKLLEETLHFALSPKEEFCADLLRSFLTAKKVESCSSRTIAYYKSTIHHMADKIANTFTQIESDNLRRYLSSYEARRNAGKVTIDNIRRILSSFFLWLEDEDYIVKSPVRRIHRVKTASVTKEVLSDEDLLPGRTRRRVRHRQPHRRKHVSRKHHHKLAPRSLLLHVRGRHTTPHHALVLRAGVGRARRTGESPHSPQARWTLRRHGGRRGRAAAFHGDGG